MNYNEKNIVETKNEYTTFLVNIITPLLYEGIKSMYIYSLESHNKLANNTDSQNINGPLKIFQMCLKEIPALSHQIIENETRRIKEFSKCSEWFDNLVKATIKSNIILLTYTPGKTTSLSNSKFHETIDIHNFIHKCYIESAKAFYNNPELFWHEYSALEIKRNQKEAYKIIKLSIMEAIRKMLPIQSILTEYLSNEFISPEIMRQNVEQDMYQVMESDGKNLLDNPESNLLDDFKPKSEENKIITPEKNKSNYDDNENNEINPNYNDQDNSYNDSDSESVFVQLESKLSGIEKNEETNPNDNIKEFFSQYLK